MANKILVFDKLAFDPATLQYFQVILIDGGTSYSMYIKDVAAPTNPSLAANLTSVGAIPVIAPGGAGDVVGLGTTGTVPLWTDGPNSVIGDSVLTQVAGVITTTGKISLSQTGLLFGATNVFRIVGTMSSDSSLYLGDAAGAGSATGLENVGIGGFALNAITSATGNTVVGFGAAFKITSSPSNTAIGQFALFNLATGTGSNVAIGGSALHELTTGASNVGIGNLSLNALTTTNNNTAIGVGAGTSATGSGNVFIGFTAGAQQVAGDNKLFIANTNTTTPLIGGDFSVPILTIGGFFQWSGAARMTADIANATTTFANLTTLTISGIISGRKYFGRAVVKCNNTTAAEGVKFDFNGGSATVSAFWAAASASVGGTTVLGTVISTSLAGVINFTTITGETLIVIEFSFVASGNGTLILRFAENSAAVGTVTAELGSNIHLFDSPN